MPRLTEKPGHGVGAKSASTFPAAPGEHARHCAGDHGPACAALADHDPSEAGADQGRIDVRHDAGADMQGASAHTGTTRVSAWSLAMGGMAAASVAELQ